jgi:hypothetical protein
MYFFELYGLTVQSDVLIPQLAPVQPPDAPDLKLWTQHAPPGIDLTVQDWQPSPRFKSTLPWNQGEDPILRVFENPSGELIRFQYNTGTVMIFADSGDWVYIALEDEHNLPAYFLGPGAGFIHRLRGTLLLHACVVEIEGRAIAFAGPTGAGKSTLCHQLAAEGYTILADDVGALLPSMDTVQWLVQPGYPYLRLYEHLIPTELLASGLNRVMRNHTKFFVPINVLTTFAKNPIPLAHIIFLQPRGASFNITPVLGQELFIEITKNTYLNHLLSQPMRVREFGQAAQLAAGVQGHRVRFSDDIDRLPDDLTRLWAHLHVMAHQLTRQDSASSQHT